ncbi:hypothetical protein JCM10212_001349 [Sporobolomyces blumeae]
MVCSVAIPPAPPLAHVPTSELATSLASITHDRTSPRSVFTNWATTFKSQTDKTFAPTTVDEVRRVVELARRRGKELRACGAGHSPSDIVCTGGYMVDVRGLNKLLAVDGEMGTFHAQGGILLRDLHPQLEAQANLALSSLGSISDQTLAGAVSTSTHGTGVSYGSLSTFVTFLDLVLPLADAPVVRVSRDQDPDLFLSALCGIGAFGIIVGVGMRCEKVFRLEEETFSMRFDVFEKHWREIAESAEHVRCWWFPQIGKVKVSRLNRTTKAITRKPNPIKTWIVTRLISTHYHALVLFLSRRFPSLLPYHAHVMWNLTMQPGPLRLSHLFGKIDWPRPRPRSSRPAIENGAATTRTPAIEDKVELLEVPRADLEKRVLATPPPDILSPPITPPTLSPIPSDVDVSSSRSESSCASDAESEVDPDVEVGSDKGGESVVAELEKVAQRQGGDEERMSKTGLPWPILEDETVKTVDTSVGIFNYDCGFPQYTYEGLVPYGASTTSALSSLNEWHVRELHNPKGYELKAHFPIEIRWTEKDDVWMAPTYGTRGTYLGAIQYRPYNLPVPYRGLFSTFASLLTLHGGRPHWAKTHTLTPSVLHATYPRFGDFLKVRERVDPERVLVNGYMRRHVLGEDEDGRKLGDAHEDERWEARAREWKVRRIAPDGERDGRQTLKEDRPISVPREAVIPAIEIN